MEKCRGKHRGVLPFGARAGRAAIGGVAEVASRCPIDALWWATVDPATLLFTQAYREEIPVETGPYFVANEFSARGRQQVD